jgi:hypothetical protein
MKMRFAAVGALCAVLSISIAGCYADGNSGSGTSGGGLLKSSVQTPPSVVHRSGNNIEVTYLNGGIQRSFHEAEAMALIQTECNGNFLVVNRTRTTDGHAYVDATCIR